MKYEKVEAIVAKHYPLGETSNILVLLTKERGKLKAVAKGNKKLKNALFGGTQPVTYSEFVLYNGKGGLKTITQYKAIDPFMKIKSDLVKTAWALFYLEVCQDFFQQEEENRPLFDLLYQTLRFLEQYEGDMRVLEISFLMHLFSVIGYMPEMNFCSNCKKDWKAQKTEEAFYFSAKKGGVLCPDCSDGILDEKIYLGDVKMLSALRDWDYKDLERLKIPEKNIRFYESILIPFLEYYMERKIKSIDFIKKLN